MASTRSVETPLRVAGPGERGVPLWKVVAGRVGAVHAPRVLAFMVQWRIARRDLGDGLTTADDYAAYWATPRATAFRHQALFRQAFPGEQTPDRLLEALHDAWDERRGAAGLRSASVAA